MLSLRIVGTLYLLSGLWCAVNVDLSANSLGFVLSNAFAQSEYFSVYGGLQIGLACALILGSFRQDTVPGTLYAGMVFSIVLFTFRVLSWAFYGIHSMAWILACVEGVLALVLGLAWWRYTARNRAGQS